MGITNKLLSTRDANQVLQAAGVSEDDTIMTSGFLTGAVGRKIAIAVTTTSVAGDTQVISFSENGTALYTLTLVYSDATQSILLNATRSA
jgi:hypothetical protein